MTRHLAVEWGPQNIRVNSLAPGPISGTEGFRRLGKALGEPRLPVHLQLQGTDHQLKLLCFVLAQLFFPVPLCLDNIVPLLFLDVVQGKSWLEMVESPGVLGLSRA